MKKQPSTRRDRAPRNLTGNPALRIAVLFFAILVAFVALRGSSSGSDDRSMTDPRVFTGKFLSAGFGGLMGSGSPEDIL